MRARIVTAARGARWLAEGWRLFRAAPVGWLALVFAYWFVMTVVSIVPYLGIAIALILVPAFSVGFMAAGRAAEAGRRVEVGLLFEGFRHAPRTQLVLGAVYFVCLMAVFATTMLADDGVLAGWMLTGRRPDEAFLDSSAFLWALGCATALYAPVMMLFWFAPPLAAWHSVGAGKALFFSLAACLMNWRAFIAYGVATALFTVVLPLLVLSALALLAYGSLQAPIGSLVVPVAILMLPTLFASFYVSYRDVFGAETT